MQAVDAMLVGNFVYVAHHMYNLTLEETAAILDRKLLYRGVPEQELTQTLIATGQSDTIERARLALQIFQALNTITKGVLPEQIDLLREGVPYFGDVPPLEIMRDPDINKIRALYEMYKKMTEQSGH